MVGFNRLAAIKRLTDMRQEWQKAAVVDGKTLTSLWGLDTRGAWVKQKKQDKSVKQKGLLSVLKRGQGLTCRQVSSLY